MVTDIAVRRLIKQMFAVNNSDHNALEPEINKKNFIQFMHNHLTEGFEKEILKQVEDKDDHDEVLNQLYIDMFKPCFASAVQEEHDEKMKAKLDTSDLNES